jgi:hypothetical protein
VIRISFTVALLKYDPFESESCWDGIDDNFSDILQLAASMLKNDGM